MNANNFFFSLQLNSRLFYGNRNAALETTEQRGRWVAPDDAENSDVDVNPLDDSDDEDPSYVPDEDLTHEDAFDSPPPRG